MFNQAPAAQPISIVVVTAPSFTWMWCNAPIAAKLTPAARSTPDVGHAVRPFLAGIVVGTPLLLRRPADESGLRPRWTTEKPPPPAIGAGERGSGRSCGSSMPIRVPKVFEPTRTSKNEPNLPAVIRAQVVADLDERRSEVAPGVVVRQHVRSATVRGRAARAFHVR